MSFVRRTFAPLRCVAPAAAGFVLGVAATAAAIVSASGEATGQRSRSLDRHTFHQAVDTVLDRYVDPVDESQILAVGLKGLLSELDPHSYFLSASERRALRGPGRAGSTGLSVVLRGRQDSRSLEVVGVRPKSAAARAGVSPGDHVLAIGQTSVERVRSQADAELLLAGAVGDKVALKVQRRRDPGPRQLRLELEPARRQAVRLRLMPVDGGHVAHLRIAEFGDGSGQQVKTALASIHRRATKLRGVVLDLRGNPGGKISEALVVADMFVADGVLTRTVGREGQILREETAHRRGTDEHTPLAVLIDRHSASASELLAIALQDHGRARVVGERSFGKGTVQEVIGLNDGAVLTLTIARYHSPNGSSIDRVGVTPDVAVAEPSASGVGPLHAAVTALGLKAQR